MLSETMGSAARLANLLAPERVAPPSDFLERLLQKRAPITLKLGERAVSVTFEEAPAKSDMLSFPVQIGDAICQLHIPNELGFWLQQSLHLSGRLADEQEMQRALLLELACLDLCQKIETQLGETVRVGEGKPGKLSLVTGIRIVSGDEGYLCRLAMPKELGGLLADALDRLQAPEPPDLSGHCVAVVVTAGSQELFLNELDGLRPGDIVMLEGSQPAIVIEGKLAAAVEFNHNSVVLACPLAPLPMREPLPSKNGKVRKKQANPICLAFEFGRITISLSEVEALVPGSRLPLAIIDTDRVDIIRDGKRIGRGEIVKIGEGTGIRVTHLPNAASAAYEQVT
ncbi:FliM/FliN family flagellar motor switch protein [Brucella sp. BE17]|uniref:FliM/FliN family flagellar motor switch protein n=1 Tax=Brucella sp. BE17 TaxID=3142977 RepID=UPI0031BAA36B